MITLYHTGAEPGASVVPVGNEAMGRELPSRGTVASGGAVQCHERRFALQKTASHFAVGPP